MKVTVYKEVDVAQVSAHLRKVAQEVDKHFPNMVELQLGDKTFYGRSIAITPDVHSMNIGRSRTDLATNQGVELRLGTDEFVIVEPRMYNGVERRMVVDATTLLAKYGYLSKEPTQLYADFLEALEDDLAMNA